MDKPQILLPEDPAEGAILFQPTNLEITERSDFDPHSPVKAKDLGEDLGDGFFLDARPALIQRDGKGAIARITPLEEIDGVRVYGVGDPEVAETRAAPVKLSRAQREKLVDTLALRLFKYYQSLPPDAQKYNPFRDGIPDLPDGHNKALNSERGQAVGMILNPSTTEVMGWLRKFVGARAQLVNKKEGYGGIADVALRISRNPV